MKKIAISLFSLILSSWLIAAPVASANDQPVKCAVYLNAVSFPRDATGVEMGVSTTVTCPQPPTFGDTYIYQDTGSGMGPLVGFSDCTAYSGLICDMSTYADVPPASGTYCYYVTVIASSAGTTYTNQETFGPFCTTI